MELSRFKCPITTVDKNRLFYDQYHYSAKFDMEEIGVIRGLKFDHIERIVAYRNAWRSQAGPRHNWVKNLISDENVKQLKTMCSLLRKFGPDIKFVVSLNRAYVYTNNLAVLDEIQKVDFIREFSISHVNVISDTDAIALRNPKWAYRTFFRSITLDEHQRNTLIQYLNSRQNIKLGPGLKFWCNQDTSKWWQRLTQNYFFIDHNDAGEIFFLNLVIPRITAKTFRLVAK